MNTKWPRFVFSIKAPWLALYALARGGRIFVGAFVTDNTMVLNLGVEYKTREPVWWSEWRFPLDRFATNRDSFVMRTEGPRQR